MSARSVLTIFAAATAAIVTACGSHERAASSPPSQAASTIASNAVVLDRAADCDARAGRLAAWRGRTVDTGARDASWISHDSERDAVCYALIAVSVPVRNGEPPALVLEFWDAGRAMLLAEATADPRDEMRRGFCRVDLSEDPFTSCEVAEFFIRDHMAH